MKEDKQILEIVKLVKANPAYSVRYCYNNTGEIVGPKGTYDIYNSLDECIEILKTL